MARLLHMAFALCMGTALAAISPVTATAGQGVSLSSDTASVTLQQMERRFAERNLQLLAARCNIAASRASAMQASLWNNPTLGIEQNIYNPITARYFDFSPQGNTDIQVQQLFLLAGKRGKQVQLADITTQMSEATFYDLLRALLLELRTDFFDLAFLQRSVRFYDESIGPLRKTVETLDKVYAQRSILLAEVLRVKTLLLSLENDRRGLQQKINDLEGGLRILVHDSTSTYLIPQLPATLPDSADLYTLTLPMVLDQAEKHRPDLSVAQATTTFEETNLALQKAMAVPNVALGVHWSRNGGFVPNYFGLTLQADLPLFNRNQGNIEVSERTLEADRLLMENQRQRVRHEVESAYARVMETERLSRQFDTKFPQEYRNLVSGMIANYERRNISVIEFTDFFEAYRSSMLQLHQLENDRLDAYEGLNYATGTTIISLKE